MATSTSRDVVNKCRAAADSSLTKTVRSGPPSTTAQRRRYSLPGIRSTGDSRWSTNSSSASLHETEEAARGEHVVDGDSIAHRLRALRQLNGVTRTSHPYAKSTGARNSTFSQPVIVRTYSSTRPQSRAREQPIRRTKPVSSHRKVELPPKEAFTFKGIMDAIQDGVAEDLERIAEICARSRYSLSNQYEVHMPPHGDGTPYQQQARHVRFPAGLTLQAVVSDDDQSRHSGTSSRSTRTGRRTKSGAVGTLETIMSSSRSSDEDNSKKRPAGVLAEEVRDRTARKNTLQKLESPGHAATFVSLIIDNAQGFGSTASKSLSTPSTSLASLPAQPTASHIVVEEKFLPIVTDASSDSHQVASSKPSLTRVESMASTLRPDTDRAPYSIVSLASWLPWNRHALSSANAPGSSFAEGSLRQLLKDQNIDIKGKGVDRGG